MVHRQIVRLSRHARAGAVYSGNPLRSSDMTTTMMLAAAFAMIAPLDAKAEPITSPGFPGKCIDAGSQEERNRGDTPLRLSDCDNSPAQNFRFEQDASTFRLPQLSPVLCLDVPGTPLNGRSVVAKICEASQAQKWTFPFDGRVRPVGVDPNKCLTHTTRPGKPPTGWVVDVVLLDPGCEFPEAGGGFCSPTFGIFFEMTVSSCDGRKEQQWRMQQPGLPFPPDGLVSRKVHVSVNTMHIDDCREAGACDWKLHCGIGSEADIELVGMTEKNTGGTIDIRRQLVHEGGLPVTVTCRVMEFDRGIFDPDVWEHVGTATRTFGAAGPSTIGMDHSEGKVTINLDITPVGVIQQPQTVESPPLAPTKIDALLAMRMTGFDYSVPEADMRQWLGNPEFTPYPAIAGALVKLLAGSRLRRPVFLDVIVFNYEHAPGASSPRKVADVDLKRLERAVVEGHNTRYGANARDLRSLIR